MADTLRESLPKLPKRDTTPVWTPKLPQGVVSQASYHERRGKKVSWRPK